MVRAIWMAAGDTARNLFPRTIRLILAMALLAVSLTSTAPALAADLSKTMAAVAAEDWPKARRLARNQGELANSIVEWHRLRAGPVEGGASFGEYRNFLQRHPDWPGLPMLRRWGEIAMPASTPPKEVLEYFLQDEPATGPGAMRLAAAFRALGEDKAAQAEVIRAWTTLSLSPADESTLLAEYGQILAKHHITRLDMLLWRHRFTEAQRMAPRVPEAWRKLMAARIALRRNAPGVDPLIKAVPDTLKNHPGLAYERMEWRARKNREDGVLEIMLAHSDTAETLGRPEAWAKRRRPLAREMMRQGRTREAYLLASQHHLSDGVDFADLEWLAGYIALRKLDNPAAALDHFRRFRMRVNSTISLGRAGYWEGRAHEALNQPSQAVTAYEFGAEFQTSFYGQLAAEKAGLPMDPRLSGNEAFPIPANAAFLNSDVYAAGKALHEAGELVLAARFFAHMAESMSRAEIGQMARALEDLGSPHIQLRIGKRASSAGQMLHRALFPLLPLPRQGTGAVPPELVLAIARRESEFNPSVRSPAGALGLMQLMPATAQETANALDLPYSKARLTRDPAYNARLGIAYLDRLQRRFGQATILVAAGYNAGPSRPARWIKDYGDPRGGKVDPVDWIEHIPFRETRNYVMRVMESLAPYRARLSERPSEWRLSQELRAK
ncbi:MAG: lytic transglycosylase domain-containing protein [Mangrovicoccus sp.]|nr:lytic transglycosylase domain-containing protein [Mangrovicoccus sp.]